VVIKGDAAACVFISQTADADLFSINLNNNTGLFANAALRISGVTMTMSGSSSSTHNAISITTNAITGAAPIPIILDDLTFTGRSAAYWANEILINGPVDNVYISRINGYAQNVGTTHISVAGTSGGYTSSVFIRDTFLVNGVGVVAGNYIQGIQLDNINTVGTQYAFKAQPSAGLNIEYNIANSYLDGKTIVSPSGAATIGAVKFHHNYFDGLNGVNNSETQVTIASVGSLDLDHNTYSGPASAKTSVTGLSITGSNVTPAKVVGETFTAFAGTSNVALSVNVSTYTIGFSNLSFSGNTANITDTSSVSNRYDNSVVDNQHYSWGAGRDGMDCAGGAAGGSVAQCNTVGPDANIQQVWNAKGLPGTDWQFRDGLSRGLLALKDSQNGSSSVGLVGQAAITGVSPSLQPSAGNLLLGVTGSPLATSVTSGLPQIPYMAGKPTGTPASTGGASMVYDTTDNWLCIYNPTGTPGWKCSAAFAN
jgi:hypothetical protein